MQSRLSPEMQRTHQTITVERVTGWGINVPGASAVASSLGAAGMRWES
jgi:hypothetical protein